MKLPSINFNKFMKGKITNQRYLMCFTKRELGVKAGLNGSGFEGKVRVF